MFYGIDLGMRYTYSVTQTYPSTNLVVARVFMTDMSGARSTMTYRFPLHGVYRRYIVPGARF
jgi:hypothetical protein